MSSGAHLFDRRTCQLDLLVDPEPEQVSNGPKNRLNDGKVGPDGAFWVGSMHAEALMACLYRITGDGGAERKIGGLATSNGLAFTADGRTMFHADSRQCWVDRYDLDPATGTLSGRTRIAHPDEAMGRPDGAAADLEGRYWSAGVSAGVLNCFSREGRWFSRSLFRQSIRRCPALAAMTCGRSISRACGGRTMPRETAATSS